MLSDKSILTDSDKYNYFSVPLTPIHVKLMRPVAVKQIAHASQHENDLQLVLPEYLI